MLDSTHQGSRVEAVRRRTEDDDGSGGRKGSPSTISTPSSSAPSQPKRKCSTQSDDVDELLDDAFSTMPRSTSRKPSFADCMAAGRRTSAWGECFQKTIAPHPDTPTMVSALDSSHRPGCTPQTRGGQYTADTPDAKGGSSFTVAAAAADATNSAASANAQEVAILRELVERHEADLKMAALIGQRLLDTQEELSAELEAVREEKWLVDCEKDALRRDLERATQRCDQMQHDTATAAPDPGSANEREDLDAWSRVGEGVSEGRVLSTTIHSNSPSTDAAPAAATTSVTTSQTSAHEREVSRLRQVVENLESDNATLEEALVEARLETSALRRCAVEIQKKTQLEDLSNSDGGEASEDSDNGQQQRQRRRRRQRRRKRGTSSPGEEETVREAHVPQESAVGVKWPTRSSDHDEYSGSDKDDCRHHSGGRRRTPPARTKEGKMSGIDEERKTGSTNLPESGEPGQKSHRLQDQTRQQVHNDLEIRYEGTSLIEKFVEPLDQLYSALCSSSAAHGKRQLIEGLRENMAQLRLELQEEAGGTVSPSVAVSTIATACRTYKEQGKVLPRGRDTGDEKIDHDGRCAPGNDTTHLGDGADGKGNSCGNNNVSDSGSGSVVDNGTNDGSRGGKRKEDAAATRLQGLEKDETRKTSGGDSRVVSVEAAASTPSTAHTIHLLEEQVDELSAKLASANSALATLRRQAKADQTLAVELQREVMSLYRLRERDKEDATAASERAALNAIPRHDGDGGGRACGHDCGSCVNSGGGGGGDGTGCEIGARSREGHQIDTGRWGWLHWLWQKLLVQCGHGQAERGRLSDGEEESIETGRRRDKGCRPDSDDGDYDSTGISTIERDERDYGEAAHRPREAARISTMLQIDPMISESNEHLYVDGCRCYRCSQKCSSSGAS